MNAILNFQKVVLFISSLLLVTAFSITVIFRYFLKLDLFGLEELIIIPTFLMYFFGATYASSEKSHISADILQSFIKKEKYKSFLKIFISVVSLFATGMFAFWASQYLFWSIEHNERTAGYRIPLYIPHGIVFTGFLLMSVYVVLDIVKEIKLIKKFKRGEE